jgi:hypothetical protein
MLNWQKLQSSCNVDEGTPQGYILLQAGTNAGIRCKRLAAVLPGCIIFRQLRPHQLVHVCNMCHRVQAHD